MNTENFTIEKTVHPFNSKLKWRVIINKGIYPFKQGIYGYFLTKKNALKSVSKLEEFVETFGGVRI